MVSFREENNTWLRRNWQKESNRLSWGIWRNELPIHSVFLGSQEDVASHDKLGLGRDLQMEPESLVAMK